jgi:hypothetical protein
VNANSEVQAGTGPTVNSISRIAQAPPRSPLRRSDQHPPYPHSGLMSSAVILRSCANRDTQLQTGPRSRFGLPFTLTTSNFGNRAVRSGTSPISDAALSMIDVVLLPRLALDRDSGSGGIIQRLCPANNPVDTHINPLNLREFFEQQILSRNLQLNHHLVTKIATTGARRSSAKRALSAA